MKELKYLPLSYQNIRPATFRNILWMVSQKDLLFLSLLGHIHSNARAKNKLFSLLWNWFASLKAKTLFLLPAEIAPFVSLSEIIKKHVRQRERDVFFPGIPKAIEYYKSELWNYTVPL